MVASNNYVHASDAGGRHTACFFSAAESEKLLNFFTGRRKLDKELKDFGLIFTTDKFLASLFMQLSANFMRKI